MLGCRHGSLAVATLGFVIGCGTVEAEPEPATEVDAATMHVEASSGESTPDDGSSTGESIDASTGTDFDPCGPQALPACSLCPDSLDSLCGAPCPVEGDGCHGPDGDGMQCIDGTWMCFQHPPIYEGCDEVCILSDACEPGTCEDALELVLAPTSNLPGGSWELSWELDDRSGVCHAKLGTDESSCSSPAPCLLESDCDSLLIDRSVEPARVGLGLPMGSVLAVQLKVEGQLVVSDAFEGAVDLFAPVGRGCSPVCAAAQVTVELP